MYRSYLLAYASHGQKGIFDVQNLELQAIRMAFGLSTSPRVDLDFSARGIPGIIWGQIILR